WPLLSQPSMKSSLLCVLFIVATSSSLLGAEPKTVDDFRAAAAKANAVLTIPDWEQTPGAVEASMKDAIAKANNGLDQIGAQDLSKVTLKSCSRKPCAIIAAPVWICRPTSERKSNSCARNCPNSGPISIPTSSRPLRRSCLQRLIWMECRKASSPRPGSEPETMPTQ